jgi:hypothetical protein
VKKLFLCFIFAFISISALTVTRESGNGSYDISKGHITLTAGVNMYDFTYEEDPQHPNDDPMLLPQKGGTNAECAIDFPIAKSWFIEGGIITWSNTDFSRNGSTLTLFYQANRSDIIFGIGTIPGGQRIVFRGYDQNKNFYAQGAINRCNKYPAWLSLNVGITF